MAFLHIIEQNAVDMLIGVVDVRYFFRSMLASHYGTVLKRKEEGRGRGIELLTIPQKVTLALITRRVASILALERAVRVGVVGVGHVLLCCFSSC